MATGRSLLNEASPRILPGLPRKSMTPEQQLEALRKVQAQAEQRVKLGMQLFKSAEARLAAHSDLVSQVRSDQKYLRDRVAQDMDQRLSQYDRKLEQFDDRLDEVVQALEGKIDAIAAEWRQTQSQLDQTREHCESLLAQARSLLEDKSLDIASAQPAQPVSEVTPLDELENEAVEPVAQELPEVDLAIPESLPLPVMQDPEPIAEVESAPEHRDEPVSDAASNDEAQMGDRPGPRLAVDANADTDEQIYSQILSRLREQDAA